MKTAIILAAGVGSRLRPLTESVPKCCVKVAGIPLIRRITSQILAYQPDAHIYIATGYLGDVVREELADLGDLVTFVENADYATTNNMESCRRVLDVRTETGPSLIINADCIYSDAIVQRMIGSHGNRIGVDSSEYFEENMKVYLDNGRIRKISKALSPAKNIVTSIDIYSFKQAQLDDLHEIMTQYHTAGDLNQWTEVAIGDLLSRTAVEVLPEDFAGEKWVEIDNHDDLAQAERYWS